MIQGLFCLCFFPFSTIAQRRFEKSDRMKETKKRAMASKNRGNLFLNHRKSINQGFLFLTLKEYKASGSLSDERNLKGTEFSDGLMKILLLKYTRMMRYGSEERDGCR